MTVSMGNLIMLYAAVFFAGLVDSIAGGGGLVSIPAYLVVFPLQPQLAAGTNKFSAFLGTAFATFRFIKGGQFNTRAAIASIPLALLGSYIGASLALNMDSKYFKYCLLAGLPVIAVFMLMNKKFGEEDRQELLTVKRISALSAASGFIIGIYDGFFGPGTGTFLILIHTGIIGFGLAKASGNAKIVNLSTNVAAFITFLANNQIDLKIGAGAAVCGIVGNWIGSGLAVKKGSKVIRPMFVVVIIILMVKVLYDLISVNIK